MKLPRWKGDPLGYPRNPLAVYLLALALFSGTLSLFGINTAKSIEDTLPLLPRMVWAFLLVSGSAASLVGAFWPGSIPTGLTLKRLGAFTLGVASFLYAIVLVVAFGLPGLTQAGIIAGLGVACWIHHRQIVARINQVVDLSLHPEEGP